MPRSTRLFFSIIGLLMGSTSALAGDPLPIIDAHVHIHGPKDVAIEIMNRNHIESVVNISVAGLKKHEGLEISERFLRRGTDAYPGRFRYCSSFATRYLDEPGFAEKAIEKLSRDWPLGTTPVVKVWKELGMLLKDKDGHYVHCDDERFAPVFSWLNDRKAIVFIHIADPIDAWLPLEPNMPYYTYFTNNKEVYMYDKPGVPKREEILAARDRLVSRWKDIRWIGCHLASHEDDLERLGKFLDDFPNAWVDTAARVKDLEMRFAQDEVREFLVRYQDRVLFGTDWSVRPRFPESDSQQWQKRTNYSVARLEHSIEYFEKLLGLPEKVKRKIMYENARDLFGPWTREAAGLPPAPVEAAPEAQSPQ